MLTSHGRCTTRRWVRLQILGSNVVKRLLRQHRNTITDHHRHSSYGRTGKGMKEQNQLPCQVQALQNADRIHLPLRVWSLETPGCGNKKDPSVWEMIWKRSFAFPIGRAKPITLYGTNQMSCGPAGISPCYHWASPMAWFRHVKRHKASARTSGRRTHWRPCNWWSNKTDTVMPELLGSTANILEDVVSGCFANISVAWWMPAVKDKPGRNKECSSSFKHFLWVYW